MAAYVSTVTVSGVDGRVFPARSSTVTVGEYVASPHGAGGVKLPASSPCVAVNEVCRSITRDADCNVDNIRIDISAE